MFWVSIISVFLANAAPPSHQVISLPGIASFNFLMYSGYLPIPNSNGKELHYVFYTSQNNPATDPLVLWLNGGPGCSSLEGAFMENGPFVFSETNNSMYVNPYSWNTNASMLYIEAPAGVGYSVLGEASNLNTGDNQTAADNLQALLQWFAYFPEYTNRSFFISGESYAGIYVPTLAYQILQYTNNTSNNSPFNLTGFIVGNAVTDWAVDADAVWPYFLYWHALIDDTIWFPWVNAGCSGLNASLGINTTPYCAQLYNSMLNLFTGINYYDIYRNCISPDYMRPITKARWGTSNLKDISECVPDNALTIYLNTPRVRNALHINTTVGAWEECTDLNYTIDYSVGSYYLYPSLIASGIRIHVYSGDTDSCVPTLGTLEWLNNLNIPLAVNWTEWTLNDQVGGFFMRYGPNLSFNTIRGSGHMCIQWNRPAGFQMFTSFLLGQDLAN